MKKNDDPNEESRPNPDPTILTTEAALRLERRLTDLIEREVAHTREVHNDTLDAEIRLTGERFTSLRETVSAQGRVIEVSSSANSEKINDLKDRVVTIESGSRGAHGQTESFRSVMAVVISAIIALIAIISLVVVLNRSPADNNDNTPFTNTSTTLPTCDQVSPGAGIQCITTK